MQYALLILESLIVVLAGAATWMSVRRGKWRQLDFVVTLAVGAAYAFVTYADLKLLGVL